MPDAYDHISLICRLKATQTKNKELESGERYVVLCQEKVQIKYNQFSLFM